MALYKDSNNKVHDDMEGAALHLPSWPKGLIQITLEEADALRAPKPPTIQEQKDAIQAQIDTLERQQLMPRLSRDIYLALMLKEAAAAGFTEPQLYLANIGYARLKDFDAVINGLRAQMDAIV